jgi:hypothetical protein
MVVRVQEAASLRLDEIHRHTSDSWGGEQSARYVRFLRRAAISLAFARLLARLGQCYGLITTAPDVPASIPDDHPKHPGLPSGWSQLHVKPGDTANCGHLIALAAAVGQALDVQRSEFFRNPWQPVYPA